MTANYVLKLYIAGLTVRSKRAISNLRRICEEELNGDYVMDVIDILEQPQLAEGQRILATPTLIRELPAPAKRVIGDLSDYERVLASLDIPQADMKRAKKLTEAQSDGSGSGTNASRET